MTRERFWGGAGLEYRVGAAVEATPLQFLATDLID